MTALEELVVGNNKEGWLETHVGNRLDTLWRSGNSWRIKMEKFFRRSENDLRDRANGTTPDQAFLRIFRKTNLTLDVTGGFSDFLYAQVSADIFGSKPWLTVKPVGQADFDLATTIERHSHWKLNQSNIERGLRGSLQRACDLGTGFVAIVWRRDVERYEQTQNLLYMDGKPVTLTDGNPVTDQNYQQEPAASMLTALGISNPEWKTVHVEKQDMVYDNVECREVDFRNIAFDITAPDLDLIHTDVFVKIRIKAQDAAALYEIPLEKIQLLTPSDVPGQDGTGAPATEAHRQEDSAETGNNELEHDNHWIELWEGFVRCDPIGDGKLRRMFVVYHKESRTLLHFDYLHNRTPKGILPIFPITIYRVAGRVYGRGMYEKYEPAELAVDAFFSGKIHRSGFTDRPISGIDKSKIDNVEQNGEEVELDLEKPVPLQPNAKLADALQFVQWPNGDYNTQEFINMLVQAMQIRSGISAASQGEMSSLPDNTTATGIRQLQSRAAKLLQWPSDDAKGDITRILDYAVTLLYSEFNQAEAFVWGEGKAQELIDIKPENVAGLKMDVTLNVGQGQQVDALSNAQTGIGLFMSYLAVPEPEKQFARQIFLQALKAAGFDHADQILREGIFSPEQIAMLLPPEMQPLFMAFLQQMQAQQAAADPAALPPGSDPAAAMDPMAAPPPSTPPTAQPEPTVAS